jgi:hypothetical protein
LSAFSDIKNTIFANKPTPSKNEIIGVWIFIAPYSSSAILVLDSLSEQDFFFNVVIKCNR